MCACVSRSAVCGSVKSFKRDMKLHFVGMKWHNSLAVPACISFGIEFQGLRFHSDQKQLAAAPIHGLDFINQEFFFIL